MQWQAQDKRARQTSVYGRGLYGWLGTVWVLSACAAMAQDAGPDPQPSYSGTVVASGMSTLSYEMAGCIDYVSESARDSGRAASGQVLLRLDDTRAALDLRNAEVRVLDLEASVEQAQLSVDAAEADLDRRGQEQQLTAKEFERNSTMFRRGLINETNMEAAERRVLDAGFALDRAKEVLASARAAKKRAEIALEIGALDLQTARLNREQMTLRAPFDGILTGFVANPGDCVQASTPFAQIYDPNQKSVEIYARVDQLAGPLGAQIQIGASVRADRINGEVCAGVVQQIGSQANLETQYVRVTLDLEPGCAAGLYLNEAVEVFVMGTDEDSS